MANKTGTPSQQEIEALPNWARVAFAARCARRVQPLLKASWPNAPKEHLDAVDEAIALAEYDAAFAVCSIGFFEAVRPAYNVAVARADAAAIAAAAAFSDAVGAAVAAAVAACAAAAAVIYATANAYAADDAADAADTFNSGIFKKCVVATMRRDFELLKCAAHSEEWNDETPVPKEFFGPLWAEGEPEGWPVKEDNSEGCELVFTVELPEGTDDGEVFAKVKELAARADDLHRAYGGRGLQVTTVEVLDPVHGRKGVLR